MENILNDGVNFSKLTVDVYKTLIKYADYNDRTVSTLLRMEV